MRRLQRNLVAAVALFLITVGLYAAERILGLPADSRTLAIAVVLSGFIAAATYLTLISLQSIQEANARAIARMQAENAQLIKAVAAENNLLVQRVATEFEGYGDRRAIDAIVSTERQRIINERAGSTTLELRRLGVIGNNVTDITERRPNTRS